MIRIFVTGGTFDKEYNELNGRLFFKDTHVARDAAPRAARASTCRVRTLMMVDSLEMTDDDRALIVEQCRAVRRGPHRRHARHRHHGGDGARPAGGDIAGKTIVLTGAMIPYEFGSSDGLFNLGSALASPRRCRRASTWP